MNLISNLGQRKFDAVEFATAALKVPSLGVSPESRQLRQQLTEIGTHRISRSGQAKPVAGPTAAPLTERLFDTLAAFKVHASTVAMHLTGDWRLRLFRQLDNLLSSAEWVDDDIPPHIGSFATFLRIVLSLKPERPPGLAATADGNLIASWTNDVDRLTLECQPSDRVRWIISRELEDGPESAAGQTDIRRLPEVLAPYAPQGWLSDGDPVHRS